jgi:hypothetical protein
MHPWTKILISAAAFCALTSSYVLPAQAMGKWHRSWGLWGNHGNQGGNNGGGQGGDGQGSSNGGGWHGGSSRGAPGPIAGAGLPFLLIAGGYVLVRRYRKHSKAE